MFAGKFRKLSFKNYSHFPVELTIFEIQEDQNLAFLGYNIGHIDFIFYEIHLRIHAKEQLKDLKNIYTSTLYLWAYLKIF